ncbi:reverse transcriptase domain-containing protein [Tanacetum coccineum]
MAEEDKDKTGFFVGEGVYCYQKMPFGLKNAGATYQRLVDKVFNDQIRRNLEAYVDDMVIKITSEEDMLTDIKETFQRVLHGAELNYPTLEKILALVHVARMMRRYFQAYTVAVLTNSSIKQALTKPKKSGRIAKWAIKLGEHDIVFRARGDSNKETAKDFLIEAPPKDNRKEAGRKADTKLEETKPSCEWKFYTDGASSSDGSGAGLMLIEPEGKEYTYALRLEFETMNNESEYEALLAGLRIAQEMEIVNMAIFVDSQLLVNQIKGIYATKKPTIREYLQRIKEILRRFRSYIIEHIRRNHNKKANALSKLASMTFEHLTKEVLVEVLVRRSIEE